MIAVIHANNQGLFSGKQAVLKSVKKDRTNENLHELHFSQSIQSAKVFLHPRIFVKTLLGN